ncbi:MAG: hypothetical protein ABWY25_07580 [Paenisporosarcina sp.]
MNESQYQTRLIKRLRQLLPECIILKNDPTYMQGVPDILILFGDRWAMLEIKLTGDSSYQPNQEYYVGLLNEMSFAAFVNPQNEEDVLYDLQFALGLVRPSRIS